MHAHDPHAHYAELPSVIDKLLDAQLYEQALALCTFITSDERLDKSVMWLKQACALEGLGRLTEGHALLRRAYNVMPQSAELTRALQRFNRQLYAQETARGALSAAAVSKSATAAWTPASAASATAANAAIAGASAAVAVGEGEASAVGAAEQASALRDDIRRMLEVGAPTAKSRRRPMLSEDRAVRTGNVPRHFVLDAAALRRLGLTAPAMLVSIVSVGRTWKGDVSGERREGIVTAKEAQCFAVLLANLCCPLKLVLITPFFLILSWLLLIWRDELRERGREGGRGGGEQTRSCAWQ